MALLIFYLCLALGVSFLCSIMEAVILSVTPSFIESLQKRSPANGDRLRRLKESIDQPLAAILSLNTIAHTVGAAGVGAQALALFGSGAVAITSAILTILILVLSEIIPKTLGAFYWRNLAVVTAHTLGLLIRLLYPLVLLTEKIAVWLQPAGGRSSINREEFLAMSDLASKEGVFGKQESHILKNLLHAEAVTVRDIMTPRSVVFSLAGDATVAQVLEQYDELTFSRIPIYRGEPVNIHAYVLKTEIISAANGDRSTTRLDDIARKIQVAPSVTSLVAVFELFLNQRENIALVVDEYGGTSGIVTMEDVVETLLGIEIIDESDRAIDMQAVARRLNKNRFANNDNSRNK